MTLNPKAAPFKPRTEEEFTGFFCYRFGENGHIATKCTAPENSSKVIKKLIRQLRGNPVEGEESTRSPDGDVARVNTMEVSNTNPELPEGLVGPSSICKIKVNDLTCDALIDSGSNVTIIFESWYEKYLSHVAIQPISRLAIWGLAESEYPYKGYVVVEMEFPEEMSGVKGSVTVLAFICPEPGHGQQASVIVGTNAFLFHRLWDIAKETGSQHKVHSMRIQALYEQIQLQSKLPQKTAEEETIGKVTWQGPGPLSLAPGEKVYASCKVEKQTSNLQPE